VNQVFEPPENPLDTFCRGGIYPAPLNRSPIGLSRAAYMPPLQNAGLVVAGAGLRRCFAACDPPSPASGRWPATTPPFHSGRRPHVAAAGGFYPTRVTRVFAGGSFDGEFFLCPETVSGRR